jgi:hypothetical protein
MTNETRLFIESRFTTRMLDFAAPTVEIINIFIIQDVKPYRFV